MRCCGHRGSGAPFRDGGNGLARQRAMPMAEPAVMNAPLDGAGCHGLDNPVRSHSEHACRLRCGHPGPFRDHGVSWRHQVGVRKRLADHRHQSLTERLVGSSAKTHQGMVPTTEQPCRRLLRRIALREPTPDEVVKACGPLRENGVKGRQECSSVDDAGRQSRLARLACDRDEFAACEEEQEVSDPFDLVRHQGRRKATARRMRLAGDQR